MDSTTLENGIKIKNMELEFGNQSKEMSIWANGTREKSKDMEFIFQKADKNTKDFLSISLKMDKGNNIFQMEITSRESSRWESLKVSEFINGKTG